MADYYSILGVSRTASELEIKAAFRRLAKIYHPDKNPDNPDARIIFENALKAYNTLIHPSSRRRYDQRGTDASIQSSKVQHTRRKSQKEWTFTEEELQRRQYYEKHYKSRQQERVRQQAPPPKAHSDYKYILFATPVAVALFLLIVSIFTETPKTVPIPAKPALTEPVQTMPENPHSPLQLANGEKPYSGYFGTIRTYNTPNHVSISNACAYDAVIILFDQATNNYLQHAYLQASYSVKFNKLPPTGVYWKCMLGKNWNEHKLMFQKKVIGAFDSIIQFQNRKKRPVLFTKNREDAEPEVLDVIEDVQRNKAYISNEADFFTK